MSQIDLNADVGESFGAFTIGCDDHLMPSLTSANIAAGFHGGDPTVLRSTIRLALRHGVAIGAHPALNDLAGFGRREVKVSAGEVEDLVLYQVAAVAGVAAAEGTTLQHVKPHGALYNMAARDGDLAAAIARAVAAINHSLILVGPPRSALLHAGRAAGLRVAAEGFADRAYDATGGLVPRHIQGALITDPSLVVSRAIGMVRDRAVTALDGSSVSLEIETLCVHGDTPGADRLAVALREGLTRAGIQVASLASGA